MAWANHNDRIEGFSFDQFVGIGCHLPGIDISGMRRDKGNDFSFDFLLLCIFEVPFDIPGEDIGLSRIEHDPATAGSRISFIPASFLAFET